jgi:hypothetical protein
VATPKTTSTSANWPTSDASFGGLDDC